MDAERYIVYDFDEPARHALISESGRPILPRFMELK